MNNRSSPAVLIVEDELVVASDLQQSLGDMGYDAFAIATSFDEAVARVEERQPDIVLMDIRIKGNQDGIQTAELLKRRFPVIVIFLTAHADDSMVDRAKRTAPDGYLIKPVKKPELRSTIEVALYKRELEDKKEKLRSTERRLYTIADNVPIAIAYFDRQGKVQFANSEFREFVPYRNDPIGIAAMMVMGETLYRESYPSRQLALAGEPSRTFLDVQRGGKLRKFEVTHLPDRDADGNVVGAYSIAYDVTEREQLSADLRQAHIDLETILNAVPASITSWNMDLTNRFANRAAELQFGITRSAARGQPMRAVMGDRRFHDSQAAIVRAFAGQRSSRDYVDEQADGSRHRHDDYIPEIKEEVVAGVYALSFDVTDVHESHEKIRRLAQRLESAREEERRAISIILHDGIAQDLFALKLGLDHLKAKTRGREGIDNLCKELSAAVAKCMDDTHQIANELRPTALAKFGIGTVLARHIDHFAAHANLEIHMSQSDRFPTLDESARLLFFRAAQEALTNVARHARATHVDIRLKADSARISMEVADNGVGISNADLHKPLSLGLLGLRERFESLGGGLSVARNAPRGAVLSVHLPTGAVASPQLQ